jgi:hypothetical protein
VDDIVAIPIESRLSTSGPRSDDAALASELLGETVK